MSNAKHSEESNIFASSDVSLDQTSFMLSLLRAFTGHVEDISGVNNAESYVSLVGGEIGTAINRAYLEAVNQQIDKLSLRDVADMLVDLKRRIGGEFWVHHLDDDTIVLRNSRCPFGDYVKDRPSLCMMTSNVFGQITAQHFSYATVDIQKAIARGDAGCEVVVSLTPPQDKQVTGYREYYGTDKSVT